MNYYPKKNAQAKCRIKKPSPNGEWCLYWSDITDVHLLDVVHFFFSTPIDCYLWLMVGGYAAQNCDLGWHTPKRVLMEVALTPAPRFRIIAISLRDIYFV